MTFDELLTIVLIALVNQFVHGRVPMAVRKIPGPEVIKLEFILKLKIKRTMIGCLWTRVRKQPIIALYFEFETVLKFWNLGARTGLLREILS